MKHKLYNSKARTIVRFIEQTNFKECEEIQQLREDRLYSVQIGQYFSCGYFMNGQYEQLVIYIQKTNKNDTKQIKMIVGIS